MALVVVVVVVVQLSLRSSALSMLTLVVSLLSVSRLLRPQSTRLRLLHGLSLVQSHHHLSANQQLSEPCNYRPSRLLQGKDYSQLA